jgi:hypothetical protein
MLGAFTAPITEQHAWALAYMVRATIFLLNLHHMSFVDLLVLQLIGRVHRSHHGAARLGPCLPVHGKRSQTIFLFNLRHRSFADFLALQLIGRVHRTYHGAARLGPCLQGERDHAFFYIYVTGLVFGGFSRTLIDLAHFCQSTGTGTTFRKEHCVLCVFF